MLNLNHLLEFIDQHKVGSKCFQGWSKEQIQNVVVDSFHSNSAAVVYNADSTAIQGFCHGIAFKDLKIFHVSNCLTDGSHGVMGQFMIILERLYPDYQLEGQRYGRIKHYNTPRFKYLLKNK